MAGANASTLSAGRVRQLLALGAVLVLAALLLARGYQAVSSPNLGGERWRQAQADAVLGAVFRRQIAQHRTAGQVCFLTVDGRSTAANAAFVRRLQAGPAVKPLSQAQERRRGGPMLRNTPTINGFVDAETGWPALHFWTDGLTWVSDAEAQVEGGGPPCP